MTWFSKKGLLHVFWPRPDRRDDFFVKCCEF